MTYYYYPIIGVLLVIKIIFWVCFCAIRAGAWGKPAQRRCTVIRVDPQPGQVAYPQNPYTARSPIVEHEMPPGETMPYPAAGAPVGPAGAPIQPPSYDDAVKPGVSTVPSNPAAPQNYSSAIVTGSSINPMTGARTTHTAYVTAVPVASAPPAAPVVMQQQPIATAPVVMQQQPIATAHVVMQQQPIATVPVKQ